MKSVMVHSFANTPKANIPRSSFNRSHGVKTTFDADYLIPIFVDDVVPGDTFNLNMNFFGRLATPIYPIMDNLYLDSFWFFVPYRLVWDNWKRMQGEQRDPTDSIDYTVPVLSGGASVAVGGLAHYMGIPYNLAVATTEVSALPFRAYYRIWAEWFRDQNLQDGSDFDNEAWVTGDGPDPAGNFLNSTGLAKRNKKHDYFTSCLPWPQKGDAVSLPIQGSARIETPGGAGTLIGVWDQSAGAYRQIDTNAATADVSATAAATGMTANLAQSGTLATINDLRLAFQTQRLLERDARSGTRYNELILAHFGVTVPDFRVQRPEFLGGGSTPININPVANTSDTATREQGELAAFGTVSGSHGFTKSFVEHGVIIGLVNVRSDITYSQGLERYWSKQTRYDFFMPVLAQIGEQAVLRKEIWHDPAGTGNDDVFGYQERYAEMRYKPSRLTGLFAVDVPSSLSAWHLSEDFSIAPTLSGAFMESNTSDPLDRALAIPSEPHIIFDSYINLQCARPMPLYGVPGNLDHF